MIPPHQIFPIPLGTQTFGCAYGFSDDDPRLESARRIVEMGSNVLKFGLRHEERVDGVEKVSMGQSLVAICQQPSVVKTLLDLPFAHTLMWASPPNAGAWHVPATSEQLQREYDQLHELAVHLLTTYSGSGRSFYLGNWEGDWLLAPPPSGFDPSPEVLDSLVQRINQRQRAVDDAIRMTPHQGVNLFHYVEVNRVQDAMTGQRKRLVSHVLPHVEVDLVSYSAYDSTNHRPGRLLRPALDYIQKRLRPRARVDAAFRRRVFIGEYGYAALEYSEVAQEVRSREVMKIAIDWGCPFVLYWEMYNNEITPDGKQRGYWLIDDKNRKTLAYFTHHRYCRWAIQHLEESTRKLAQCPEVGTFQKSSIAILDKIGNEHFNERGRPAESDKLVATSLIHEGDLSRLQRVMEKARRGEPIVIGGIGGSITQGTGATRQEYRYLDRVADAWRKAFPQCKVSIVNAGIGATSSIYGCLRVGRDLLSMKPDLVVIDYGVNDSADDQCAATYEGCIRQILAQPQTPALLALFFMHTDGSNTQPFHGRVAKHYNLPIISYRDAFWPLIESDNMVWEEICHDDVHPNDRGHAAAAQFITAMLDRARSHIANDVSLPTGAPGPLLSRAWEQVSLCEAADLVPLRNEGWAFDPQTKSWQSAVPGSEIEFEIVGTSIALMWYRLRGAMGKFRVAVDGTEVEEACDGWFPGTWGGYRETRIIAGGLQSRRHLVRVRVIPKSHPESTGHVCRILGLGSSLG